MLFKVVILAATFFTNNAFTKEDQTAGTEHKEKPICQLSREEYLALLKQTIFDENEIEGNLKYCSHLIDTMPLNLTDAQGAKILQVETDPYKKQGQSKVDDSIDMSIVPTQTIEIGGALELDINVRETSSDNKNWETTSINKVSSEQNLKREVSLDKTTVSAEVVMICCKKREFSYLKYCRNNASQLVAIPRLEFLLIQSRTQQALLPEPQTLAAH